jgi:SagB-type dehydrogenase family enzyme
MNLPKPKTDGNISVEKAIKTRRSVRWFSPRQLTREQISQLLWAGQGITDDEGHKRAVPSAGALYPMELYAVVGYNSVEGVAGGIYHYEPDTHVLDLIEGDDHRDEVARACLSQLWMAKAPLNVAICAEYQRMTVKYGKRGERYVAMEAGNISQNIFLQARAMGLEAGIVGAFVDGDLKKALKAPENHEPLLVMPVGYR